MARPTTKRIAIQGRPPASGRAKAKPGDKPTAEAKKATAGKSNGSASPAKKPAGSWRDYLRDAAGIQRESFATIRREVRLNRVPNDVADVAVRLIHSCGMVDILGDLAYTPDIAKAARAALSVGGAVICDVNMVAIGTTRALLPKGNPVICTLGDAKVAELARAQGTTRAAAAVDLWLPHLAGSVVAIGNAPTALFRLLEVVQDGGPRPAAILAFPVGFVGAEESKQTLVDLDLGIPYIALLGRRGGSALAAAALNALLFTRDAAA